MLKNLPKLIAPTVGQALISLLASVVLLGLVLRNHLVSWLSGSSGLTPAELQATYKHQLSDLTHIGFMPALTIGVFWAGVGVVAYVAVVELINLFISARNEVVVDTTFTNVAPAGQRLVRPLGRLVLAGCLLVYLIVALRVLLPLWTGLAGHWVLGGLGSSGSGAILDAIWAVLGLAATIYVGWMLTLSIKNFR